MSVQLVMLRGPEGDKYHEFFKPSIVAGSVEEILADPAYYVGKVPPNQRWNVFFTAAKTQPGSRVFIEQDIIPFDIDDIDVDRRQEYLVPIASILGIPANELGIVFTGNGLQIHVGLEKPFTDPKYFDEVRANYKAVCKKIDDQLIRFNLTGHADSTAWGKAKLLRLPGTENRKPNKPQRIAELINGNIYKNGFDLVELSGIPKGEIKLFKQSLDSDFPPADEAAVLNGCDFLKYIKKGQHSEPEWYAALSILGRLPNGYALAHEYSKDHPGYNKQHCDAKLDQALEKSGPRTCENIDSLWGKCSTCPSFNKIKSPIAIKSAEKSKEIAKKSEKIKETTVVQQLLDYFGDDVVRKNRDLFHYRNGVWWHLDDDAESKIRALAFKAFGEDAKSWQAHSAFNSFLDLVPVAEANLFAPNPYCVNFLNGTLKIFKNDDQTWSKGFYPHDKKDYLINQLPYEYKPEDKSRNEKFEKLLDDAFLGDEDKPEKIRAIRQMYGACLIPAFPHLFLLFGKSGSGKTTLIMPVMEFLTSQNISRVEPHEFKGFALSSTAGKLVNIVTDIDVNKPMEDANLKKIEDRVAVRMDRKFKTAIEAPLPAVHIFGANDIPQTLEGASRAHQRRWTFIEFKNFHAVGYYDKTLYKHVFDHCPEGVLNFALEGLDDILASNGHFLNPASGKEAVDQWLVGGDIVQQFLDAIDAHECETGIENIILKRVADSSIKKPRFYDLFKQWAHTSGHCSKFGSPMSNIKFYSVLRQKRLSPKHTKSGDVFEGFAEVNKNW